MEIKSAVINLFEQLRYVLEAVDKQQYRNPSVSLGGSTIGQHIRHSLEFFTCLIEGKKEGIVNYDRRKRESQLEEEKELALVVLDELSQAILSTDDNQQLVLELSYSHTNTDPISVSSNFQRELVYNIEHAIHHMALIKIGIKEVAPQVTIPEGFGVANSTIRYKKQHQEG
ncbi:MAG: DinB family protein [Cyclobacteriaceae bacterium]